MHSETGVLSSTSTGVTATVHQFSKQVGMLIHQAHCTGKRLGQRLMH
jgi:hypothetical protein